MPAKTHLKYVRKGTSWVAEAGDLIVGFVCAEPAVRDLHIWEMAVRQESQGKGIGRQLMKTVIEYARSNQFKFVTLTTFREVAWNGPFYRSLGFEVIDSEKLDARLEKILRAEISHGLPGTLRCAMRLLVTST